MSCSRNPANPAEVAKAAARQLACQARDGFVLSSSRRLSAESAVLQHVLGLIRGGGSPAVRNPVVAGYWPLGSELDPRGILHDLQSAGITVALPISGERGQALTFRRWSPGSAMVTGRYGIAEPAAENPLLLPTVVLVPLLAFDRKGGRLGYGAGYYDRTLEALRAQAGERSVLAIGLAFAVQELAVVPVGGHDQPLDRIVTENGILGFSP